MTAMTDAERARRYRRRKGLTPRKLLPHGTRAAAQRHRRANEPLCPSCATAERVYMRNATRARRQKATR